MAESTTANESAATSNPFQSPIVVPNLILIVMGPAACGKSEVASSIANYYTAQFIDGDSYHSAESIHKMKNGISLTDEDRIPWLKRLAQDLANFSKEVAKCPSTSTNLGKINVKVVLACSALKKSYRDILRAGGGDGVAKVIYIFLNCSKEILEARISARENHFMKSNMLASQLATLENPLLDEHESTYTVGVNGDLGLNEILEAVVQKLDAFS